MTEKWKAIRGYEGMYEISNQGRVRSLSRYRENHRAVQHVPEIILKEYIGRWGYALVKLCSNGKAKEMKVHRLVAEAFLNTPEKDQVNHKDGNKLNNSVENLEWCTGSENMQHAYDNGLHSLAHPVILEEYGIIFPSMASAAKFVDGKQSGIYRCIVGRNKTHRGFHFKSARKEATP
jgi:hypothetical protein